MFATQLISDAAHFAPQHPRRPFDARSNEAGVEVRRLAGLKASIRGLWSAQGDKGYSATARGHAH
ncbi:MAG TPA: hypothetical protein VF013_05185 [Candidatus Limnocylindria bacterium]